MMLTLRNAFRGVAIPVCGFVLAVSGCSNGDSSSGGAAPPAPAPFTAQILYSFGRSPTDPTQPDSELLQATDGNFYGTTRWVGPPVRGAGSGNGAVFKITPAGNATILHLFADSPDGANPNYVRLIQISDGNLYGTTLNGGANGRGAVFKLTPEGTVTIVYSFAGGPDGDHPIGGLLQGSDSNFYGMTLNYAENSEGMVFKLTPEGIATRLHTFNGAPGDGSFPQGGLIQDLDGNFYGTTRNGGQQNHGTVFKLTPAGVVTILHSFTGSQGGDGEPNANLIQGSDGNFYGTTFSGGSRGYGSVFKVTPDGVATILHSFLEQPGDAAQPSGGLVEGRDGNFYGTAYSGGSSGFGAIYRISPAGEVTVLYSFAGGPNDGAWPRAALTLGSDGNFYGTTSSGGTNQTGTFFKFVVP